MAKGYHQAFNIKFRNKLFDKSETPTMTKEPSSTDLPGHDQDSVEMAKTSRRSSHGNRHHNHHNHNHHQSPNSKLTPIPNSKPPGLPQIMDTEIQTPTSPQLENMNSTTP